MTTLKKIVFLCGLLAGNFAFAQSRQTLQIDSLISLLAANHLLNGSVLIAEHGKVIYRRSVGFADRGRHIPNSDTTTFNLASMSKPLTAIAVLQLVQKDRLKLDDPFIKYFPDFPYPAVRIRHLLTHTSGLPMVEKEEQSYIEAHPDEVLSNRMIYAHMQAHQTPLLFKPGDRWSYNNMNYALLAMLVEKISGISFSAYMHRHVFEPAGMNKTYVRMPGNPNSPRYIRPAYYDSIFVNVDSLDHTRFSTYYNLGSLYGPNNVMSTLADLLCFDKAFFAGKLLSRSLMDTAFTPVMLNNGKAFRMGSSTRSYGMGWNVYVAKTAPKDTFLFHDGHIVGMSTIFHKNLNKGQTILFYDNTGNAPLQLMVSLSSIINGQPAQNIRIAHSLVRLYGVTLVNKGADAAMSKLLTFKSDTVHYYLDELEMNSLGFDLMKATAEHHMEDALETFKVNTLLFPKSSNTYDSYAFALAQNGKKEEAVAMYRKSLLLDPNNEDGKKALEKLLSGH